jgi:Sec7-like guanine-nucleotide exchange factor
MIRLGEFFSQEGASFANLYQTYLSQFDFSNILIDQAIRDVLKKIQLPRESQQIDRILSGISKTYFKVIQEGKHKPQYFSNMSQLMTEDLVYQLSFSLMMIQTCEYNDQVEEKISCDKYINSLQFVENFSELKSSGFLKFLYQSVKSESLIALKYVSKKSKEKMKNKGSIYLKHMFSSTIKSIKKIKNPRVDILKIESKQDELGVLNMIYNEFCGMKLFNELIISYQKENIAEILR